MPQPHTPNPPTSSAAAALRLAGRLIDAIGPRPSGSAASRQTADALQAEAASSADRAWSEDFAVHPGAFLGWIRLLVLLYIAGVVLLWLQVFWLAALLATVGIAILVGQFFFYRELLDPLYPRQTGRNVLAVVEPAGEARGQLIVSGHHDSARAWVKAAAGDDRLALPTWNLNLECLYDDRELFLLTSDVNGTVQLSPELAGRGRDVPTKPIAFLTGGTDAGELARGGAEATTLIGMPWGNTQRSSVYHTPADVLSAVSPQAVAAAMELAVDLAGALDAGLGR